MRQLNASIKRSHNGFSSPNNTEISYSKCSSDYDSINEILTNKFSRKVSQLAINLLIETCLVLMRIPMSSDSANIETTAVIVWNMDHFKVFFSVFRYLKKLLGHPDCAWYAHWRSLKLNHCIYQNNFVSVIFITHKNVIFVARKAKVTLRASTPPVVPKIFVITVVEFRIMLKAYMLELVNCIFLEYLSFTSTILTKASGYVLFAVQLSLRKSVIV